MISTLALVAVSALAADGVSMKFVSSGVTAKVGGYRPMQAKMDETADIVKQGPEGLTAPKYGKLKIGDKSWAFILDEPEDKPAKLYVDTNGDGDLTNDPAPKWTARKTNGLTMYSGDAKIDLGDGKPGSLGLYRFDPSDPQRALLKNTMMFYTDFGYEVTISLDGKDYSSFVAGKPDASSNFWIDRDSNGQRSYKLETVLVGKPFNFTGTTYVLKPVGSDLKLEQAKQELPVAPLPPDLRLGKKAVPFEMEAMDGTKIDFPKTYAGKLVMLDFWATWCGPCIAELPNVTAAYEKWHDKGFDILSISFDQPNAAAKVKDFAHEHGMTWQHIYEGKGWETTLGELYDVSGIPFVLLVDGDTSEILGTSRELRGPGLTDFIGKTLAKKNGNAP
jgi:thiol-disulfide isomerase/thioredoxin